MFAATPSKVCLKVSFLVVMAVSFMSAELRAEKPNHPLVDAHQNATVSSVADLSCVQACNGACMSLKAIAINNSPITPSNCIRAMPGDTITSEFYISGWGQQLGRVRAYQARINGLAGATSGEGGTIL